MIFEKVRDSIEPAAWANTFFLEQINHHLFTYLPQIAQNTKDINVSIHQSIEAGAKRDDMSTVQQKAYRGSFKAALRDNTGGIRREVQEIAAAPA